MKCQKEIRILVTGVGRRVELMQAFREAASNMKIKLILVGADMAGTAPALSYCDYYRQICAMKDPDYINQLLKICVEESIDLVMPTIDTDLQVLADNRERFAENDIGVMISTPDKIAICRDKNFTSDFFVSCGLLAPKPCNDYRLYDGPFPCFIKPKDGSSSINAFKVDNAEALPSFAERVGDYIIQPFIDGTEYTVDIFCDFEGNPIFITPRIRMAVRSGEVLKTKIVDDAKIIDECRKLIAAFKPVGPITVQLIRQDSTGDDYYIEINPRFGGGAPLSMKSGARSAEKILAILCGNPVSYEHVMEDGAIYSRFDQSVCICPGEKGQKVKGVIFDLDDTLYPEREYVRSGFNEVGKWIASKKPDAGDRVSGGANDVGGGAANTVGGAAERISDRLFSFFEEGAPAIDRLLDEICADSFEKDELKEGALKIYREHFPVIHLYDGALELIETLKRQGIRVGIITDGRPEGQRAKIEALGLDKVISDIVITDELGGGQFHKPCDIAYRIIQRRWGIPYEQMVYVGDNPVKDFIAPGQLGMQSVYVDNPEGVHFTDKRGDLSSCVRKIDSVTDLLKVIDV